MDAEAPIVQEIDLRSLHRECGLLCIAAWANRPMARKGLRRVKTERLPRRWRGLPGK